MIRRLLILSLAILSSIISIHHIRLRTATPISIADIDLNLLTKDKERNECSNNFALNGIGYSHVYNTRQTPYKEDPKVFDEAQRILKEKFGVRYDNDIPLVVWTVFFGLEPVGNRALSLEAIKALSEKEGITHIHVTIENIHYFKVKEWHKVFEDSVNGAIVDSSKPTLLSGNHMSDYLRSYLGYYFGGLYTDVKTPRDKLNYRAAIERVAPECDVFLSGFKESSDKFIACSTMGCEKAFGKVYNCCDQVRQHWKTLVPCDVWVSRCGNPIFRDVLLVVDEYFDSIINQLRKHPAKNWRNHSWRASYLIPWAYLFGDIYHSMSLRYNELIDLQPFTVADIIDYGNYLGGNEND